MAPALFFIIYENPLQSTPNRGIIKATKGIDKYE